MEPIYSQKKKYGQCHIKLTYQLQHDNTNILKAISVHSEVFYLFLKNNLPTKVYNNTKIIFIHTFK